MHRLAALKPEQLQHWAIQGINKAQMGQLPKYIPLLQEANKRWLALHLLSLDGQTYAIGDRELTFPLMSVIKPFLLLYLLSHLGAESLFQKVGCEPSDYPFNSLTQLRIDRGFPRNPMINSGAITLASLLPDQDARSRCETLRLWLNKYGGCQLFLNDPMLRSVQSTPNQPNQAIARELASSGYIKNEAVALETYNHICCLSGTVADLARLGLLLVKGSAPISAEICPMVQSLMTTCGLYQASQQFAQQVGLPTKSGVSGAILSLIPDQGAIACYSPPLDRQGNSVAGLFLVEKIAHTVLMP
jgi:glutaminase